MKTEKLFELLTLVEGVTSKRWETVMQLVDLIAKGSIDIKDKKWDDSFKQSKPKYYPLNLGDIKTWSTFDDTCIDLYFANDTTENNGQTNNQLVCTAKIYDGHSFGGNRNRLRFEALLWLPTSFIHTIEQRIEWAFETHLEESYETHLEEQKRLWIENKKKEFLSKGELGEIL